MNACAQGKPAKIVVNSRQLFFAGVKGATDGGCSVFSDGIIKYTEAGGGERNDVVTTGSTIMHGPKDELAVVLWIEQSEQLTNIPEGTPTLTK